MTKREALRLCRKLWLWLAANPGKFKTDSPFNVRDWSCNCPCCEYTTQYEFDHQEFKGECVSICPLKKLWPRGCENPLSPYRKWIDSGFTDTVAARQIADACIERRKR